MSGCAGSLYCICSMLAGRDLAAYINKYVTYIQCNIEDNIEDVLFLFACANTKQLYAVVKTKCQKLLPRSISFFRTKTMKQRFVPSWSLRFNVFRFKQNGPSFRMQEILRAKNINLNRFN